MNITPESKNLMNFLDSSLIIKKKRINSKISHLLSDIYKEIYQKYQYTLQLKIHPIYVKKILSSKDIKMPKRIFFKTQIILNQILQKTKCGIFYSFILGNRTINVYFYGAELYPNIDTYNIYMKRIITWISVISPYSSSQCSKNLNVFIYMTTLTKKFPKIKSNVLSEFQINTAYTTTCPYNGDIVIFRKEEFFKVFLHETFHSFNLDFSSMDTTHCNLRILSIFKVRSQVNLFEVYTEFWAKLINIIFYTIETNSNYSIQLCNTLLNYERIYTMIQVVKILNFMGLTYSELFIDKTKYIYKEDTNVLSYFILQMILLFNYDNFLLFCDKNNITSDTLLIPMNFTKNVDTINKLCSFIESKCKSRDMLKNIAFVENFLNSASAMHNSFFLDNLRMAITEF